VPIQGLGSLHTEPQNMVLVVHNSLEIEAHLSLGNSRLPRWTDTPGTPQSQTQSSLTSSLDPQSDPDIIIELNLVELGEAASGRQLHLVELDRATSGWELNLMELDEAASGQELHLIELDGATSV